MNAGRINGFRAPNGEISGDVVGAVMLEISFVEVKIFHFKILLSISIGIVTQ